MKYVVVQLQVALPDNYDESVVDNAISETISGLGGKLLDSESYREFKKSDSSMS